MSVANDRVRISKLWAVVDMVFCISGNLRYALNGRSGDTKLQEAYAYKAHYFKRQNGAALPEAWLF